MRIDERARCSEKLKYKKKYVDANPPYHISPQLIKDRAPVRFNTNQVKQKPIKGF